MATSGDDLVANDYRDPNFLFDISTGAGDDYIWTNLRSDLTVNGPVIFHIDGGSGFDIFKIPDGFLAGFTVAKTDTGYQIDYSSDQHIYLTNVELIILATASGTVEYFDDPYFTPGNDTVDFNALTDLQTGLFNAYNKWIGHNWQSYWPDLYNSEGGNDTVHLPDAANYVILDHPYDPADLIWDYAHEFNAGAGDDRIYGGDYHDIINGGEGKDTISGGNGNDTIRDDPFSTLSNIVGGTIDGGIGTDTVQLTWSPSRIVDAANTIVWKPGDPSTLTATGQQLYAEYRDAAGNLVGRISIINVESITGLNGSAPPTEKLFTNYADQVNFINLTTGQIEAIKDAEQAGQVSSFYNALSGDDIVTLPNNDMLLGNTARWDSTITFQAGFGNDRVTGGSSVDRIDGGYGNDRLDGGSNNDILIGGADDDTLIGGFGADDMTGGYGNDTYYIDDLGDAATEGSDQGTDLVMASIDYTLMPYFENLTIDDPVSPLRGTGNGIANVITGGGGHNLLQGMGGDDSLFGLAGFDTLEGGEGNDHLEGGVGNDTLYGGNGNDTLLGGDGDDFLMGDAGDDHMEGGAGNDTYYFDSPGDSATEGVGFGIDSIFSYTTVSLGDAFENLTLLGSANINGTGGSAENIIIGNSGANVLSGMVGHDVLAGGEGNDTLNGGSGADDMFGGAGNDRYRVDNVLDRVYETPTKTDLTDTGGIDTVLSSVDYKISDGFASRKFIERLTLVGHDNINGTGNQLANLLTGNNGNNGLTGMEGDDIIQGGGGADRLNGGLGRDFLYGGAGDSSADLFIFVQASESVVGAQRDRIYDFVSGTDKVDLRQIDANTSLDGNQAFTFSASGPAANAIWIVDLGSHLMVSGDINGNATADFAIQLMDLDSVVRGDFLL